SSAVAFAGNTDRESSAERSRRPAITFTRGNVLAEPVRVVRGWLKELLISHDHADGNSSGLAIGRRRCGARAIQGDQLRRLNRPASSIEHGLECAHRYAQQLADPDGRDVAARGSFVGAVA